MTALLIILAIVLTWFVVAAVLALGIGRAVKIAERRRPGARARV